jgi:hypothetical protein
MDPFLIVIIGFMGPLLVLCIIGIFVVRHLNKTGQ